MKNFFKKLAFVMALAMVITSLAPAAGVFAASKPALNAKSKTLLLGNKERNTFDFNLNNKVKGSTYKWTTSNKKVATVAQNGLVKAVGNGEATIKLAIKLPTNKTTTLSATVTVKTNATSVEVTNVPTAAIKVGETVNLNRSYKTLPGTKTTDVTKFVITSENAAKAKITKNGFFTATEPGEYTVQALMAQSTSKMNAGVYTAKSEEVKVTVVNAVESVKQHDLSSVNFVFGSEIKVDEFNKADVHVNYVIGGVKIQEQKIKSVSVNADGKTVNVALYDQFIPEGTYAVSYPGMEDVTFVAAKIAADQVVGMEFRTAEAVTIGENKELEVNLFNKDGVIINQPSSTATVGLDSRVTYELATNSAYLSNLTADQLTIFNKGDVATVTATFHTYTYDGYTEKVYTATRTFVGVDKTADAAKEIVSWTISSTGSADWTKLPQFIAAEDTGRRLFVNVLLKDDTKYSNASDVSGSNKIKLTSSNSGILFVDELGYLVPVKAGEVIVTVEYNNVYVGNIKVVVNPKRVITALTLDKTSATLSNATGLGDSLTVEAKLVDQYGSVIENSESLTVNYELLSSVNGIKPLVTPAGNKITFNAEGAAKGTYTYKITHPGSATLNRIVTITVQEPDGPAVNWKLSMEAEYDVKVTKTANVDTDIHKIALYGYAKNGVKVTKESASTGFTVKVIAPDNKEYTEIDGNFNVDLVTTSGTSVSGSALIQKAKAGNYTVTAYKGTTPVARGAFKVVDTQVAPTFTVKKFETNATTANDAVAQAFTIDLNDSNKNVTPSYVDVTGTGVKTRIRVNFVNVDEAIDQYVLVHKLAIGYYVTVSPEFVY